MDLITALKTRRSIRRFTDLEVKDKVLNNAIDAAIWAPSVKNRQPWRVAVIKDLRLKAEIAAQTRQTEILNNATALLCVFIDNDLAFGDLIQDTQSMGAFIQSLLLALHANGLGAVWIGEILANAGKVKKLCQGKDSFELSAVLAVGFPDQDNLPAKRNGLNEVIFFRK